MRRLIFILPMIVAWSVASSWAQLDPPNEAGVTFAQWYTVVRDVNASKKFWIGLGGKPLKIDGTDVVKFPGVFVFISRGKPSGGSFGSAVNHVGFLVPNDRE